MTKITRHRPKCANCSHDISIYFGEDYVRHVSIVEDTERGKLIRYQFPCTVKDCNCEDPEMRDSRIGNLRIEVNEEVK